MLWSGFCSCHLFHLQPKPRCILWFLVFAVRKRNESEEQRFVIWWLRSGLQMQCWNIPKITLQKSACIANALKGDVYSAILSLLWCIRVKTYQWKRVSCRLWLSLILAQISHPVQFRGICLMHRTADMQDMHLRFWECWLKWKPPSCICMQRCLQKCV